MATILSFGGHAGADAVSEPEQHAAEEGEDYASDGSGDSFEFAFVRPLAAGEHGHPVEAAHGCILPAYPVFGRRILLDDASPSPDTYCAWAPGSPARDIAFPKSASTGEAARRFRLRDLVGRSHSDGKEKFLFLQPSPLKSKTSALSAAAAVGEKRAKKPSPQTRQQKQDGGKKKAAVTEMDMATAHRLFYSKPGAAAAGGERRQEATTSYLPYRPGIVGFFATAHALRPKHHLH